jgi:hypothetical protein
MFKKNSALKFTFCSNKREKHALRSICVVLSRVAILLICIKSNWKRLPHFNYHLPSFGCPAGGRSPVGLARSPPALRMQLARDARPPRAPLAPAARSCHIYLAPQQHMERGRCNRSNFTLALLLAPPTSSAQGTNGSGFQRPPAGFFATHPMHSARTHISHSPRRNYPLPASTPCGRMRLPPQALAANHLWAPALVPQSAFSMTHIGVAVFFALLAHGCGDNEYIYQSFVCIRNTDKDMATNLYFRLGCCFLLYYICYC